ncbi:ankyrin repeat domain-containing protein [Legionella longbeachae]|uniref:ankyrin repeat domain-containing protein n=1 Tax=Legionella longbeachae TaxID=450 RepID=UPI001247953F|nr:ankyrin repeat domain-containing protein [Legionella longbeachae]QEY51603.1 hypothetical protein FQU71_10295 [Legionella longbeachae]
MKSEITFFKKNEMYENFFKAVELGNVSLVKELLPKIPNINRYKQTGTLLYTALYTAVKKRDLDMVRLLLENNANPNARSLEGMFVMTTGRPVIYSDEELESADIERKNPACDTPLIRAALNEHYEIFDLLITHGANPNLGAHSYGPIHSAVLADSLEAIMLLLDAGADINSVEGYGQITPLHRAVQFSKFNIVKLLLEKGANDKLLDGHGKLPLDYAEENDIKNLFLIGPQYDKSPLCNIL